MLLGFEMILGGTSHASDLTSCIYKIYKSSSESNQVYYLSF